MSGAQRFLRRHGLWLAANLAALLPLVGLAWDTWQGNLSVNPIDDFTDRTGSAAIRLLLASLAVTPVQSVTGWRKVGTIRKSLGLWAFGYAVLHFFVFLGLDYGFSLRYILQDGLPTKPYIVVGFLALAILLPLAITSTRAAMRRMGRNWKRLHRWVYAAGILAVVHYLWVAKLAQGEPLLYSVILAVLLAARIPWVRTRLSGLRRRPATAPARRSPKLAPEAE